MSELLSLREEQRDRRPALGSQQGNPSHVAAVARRRRSHDFLAQAQLRTGPLQLERIGVLQGLRLELGPRSQPPAAREADDGLARMIHELCIASLVLRLH
ncbi:MAG: hypothetical protein OXR73_24470, partial [Myxococcales bacterium]|nr:hypothetical protein [Myxococcales bacterium]